MMSGTNQLQGGPGGAAVPVVEHIPALPGPASVRTAYPVHFTGPAAEAADHFRPDNVVRVSDYTGGGFARELKRILQDRDAHVLRFCIILDDQYLPHQIAHFLEEFRGQVVVVSNKRRLPGKADDCVVTRIVSPSFRDQPPFPPPVILSLEQAAKYLSGSFHPALLDGYLRHGRSVAAKGLPAVQWGFRSRGRWIDHHTYEEKSLIINLGTPGGEALGETVIAQEDFERELATLASMTPPPPWIGADPARAPYLLHKFRMNPAAGGLSGILPASWKEVFSPFRSGFEIRDESGICRRQEARLTDDVIGRALLGKSEVYYHPRHDRHDLTFLLKRKPEAARDALVPAYAALLQAAGAKPSLVFKEADAAVSVSWVFTYPVRPKDARRFASSLKKVPMPAGVEIVRTDTKQPVPIPRADLQVDPDTLAPVTFAGIVPIKDQHAFFKKVRQSGVAPQKRRILSQLDLQFIEELVRYLALSCLPVKSPAITRRIVEELVYWSAGHAGKTPGQVRRFTRWYKEYDGYFKRGWYPLPSSFYKEWGDENVRVVFKELDRIGVLTRRTGHTWYGAAGSDGIRSKTGVCAYYEFKKIIPAGLVPKRLAYIAGLTAYMSAKNITKSRLAQLLKTTRPTLYSVLDPTDQKTIRPGLQQRIEHLIRFAQYAPPAVPRSPRLQLRTDAVNVIKVPKGQLYHFSHKCGLLRDSDLVPMIFPPFKPVIVAKTELLDVPDDDVDSDEKKLSSHYNDLKGSLVVTEQISCLLPPGTVLIDLSKPHDYLDYFTNLYALSVDVDSRLHQELFPLGLDAVLERAWLYGSGLVPPEHSDVKISALFEALAPGTDIGKARAAFAKAVDAFGAHAVYRGLAKFLSETAKLSYRKKTDLPRYLRHFASALMLACRLPHVFAACLVHFAKPYLKDETAAALVVEDLVNAGSMVYDALNFTSPNAEG